MTSDGTFRRGKPSSLKPAVDEALVAPGHSVQHVVVVKRNGQDVNWVEGRDVWWDDTVGTASTEHTAVGHAAEHPLFILYTSGTTGKPKGILHTTGGYLTQTAYTHRAVFDLHPETDVFGARPTSAGSPGIPMSPTRRSSMAPRRLCMRAPRIPRIRAASGKLWRSTRSPSCTQPPRPSARS
ncbi:AMP-binding protein [Arthrobacter alpinus]|nr:AMP-binding protein [Arthrobacter alpinus]